MVEKIEIKFIAYDEEETKQIWFDKENIVLLELKINEKKYLFKTESLGMKNFINDELTKTLNALDELIKLEYKQT